MDAKRHYRGLRKKINSSFVIIVYFILTSLLPVSAQVSIVEAFPHLEFTLPVDLQNSGDGTNRIFVVEQEGRIKVFNNSPDVTEAKVFLDIRDLVISGGELGLLGLAFHPDYETNGYFYVNYTTDQPFLRTIIARYSVSSNPDSAIKDSEFRILRMIQPENNHNGGQLAFGPDGYLYIALGDGGGAGDPNNNAQNKRTLLGSILRIDVNNPSGILPYSIPDDNPFFGDSFDFREEIYAFGLRNPWRFSFDNETGRIWCGDVGQGDYEEVNIIVKGGNYGWRFKEGTHCYIPSSDCDTIPDLIDPVWEYEHGNSGGSITGGFVYRGASVPDLTGKYIYGDFVTSGLWALTYDGVSQPVNERIATSPGYITSFGIDENRELYICAFVGSGGKIYKLSSLSHINQQEYYPADYELSNAYPNPFNPSTSFSYNLPEESFVNIDVLSIVGEVVGQLKSDINSPGSHLVNWNADGMASGIYFIRMKALSLSGKRTYEKVIKVLLMK